MSLRTFLDENVRPDVLFVRTSVDVVRTSARVRSYGKAPAQACGRADVRPWGGET
jgi:hypothetical protein